MNITSAEIKGSMEKIAGRLVKIREREDIVYRPYQKRDICEFREWYRSAMTINIKKLYPNAKKGNIVYVGTSIFSAMESDIRLYVWGDISLIRDGKTIYTYTKDIQLEEDGGYPIYMHVKKGENPLLFKCNATDDEKFEFAIMPSDTELRWWSKDYLYHSRATSVTESFLGEDGVSVSALLNEGDSFDGNFVYPELPKPTNAVDFLEVYGREGKGEIAYALTYASKDGNIKISPKSKTVVFVNGKKSDNEITFKKGDTILVKSLREDVWGFEFSSEEAIGIPFLKSYRKTGDKWLLLGEFGDKANFDLSFGPEFGANFTRPYVNEDKKKVFWRLAGKDTYLRAYMDSCFFAQWYYAVMVGHLGLLRTSETLKKNEYKMYFYDSLKTMARYYDYCRYENEVFGAPNFLLWGMSMEALDFIGAMGMNMVEAYNICPDSDISDVIKMLDDAVRHNIPRFEDGTYHRPTDMWADDTHMSIPFLARLGVLKNDTWYFDECVRQFIGYKKRLFMEDQNIYSHIFFLDTQVANRIPWGRGDGWILKSLTDACEIIPDSYEQKSVMIDLIKEFCEGIKKLQDSEGLWHQVLNRHDSYAETSCTGMFILGMCRGMNNGWLDKKDYGEVVDKAYLGLMKHKVDKEGNIYGVCRGSGNSMDVEYYMNLMDITNDDHGTGIILMALAEYDKYKNSVGAE